MPQQNNDFDRDEMRDREMERIAAATAQQQASQEVTENANLLREIRRAGIDSDKYDWLEGLLGPEVASAHAIGNRGPDYEQEAKWGDIGTGMQTVAERSPGRLCRDETLSIAQGTHKRRDRSRDDPLSVDERRAVRSAFETATNFKALAVDAKGLETIGETTVTAKREVSEESDKTLAESAGGLLG